MTRNLCPNCLTELPDNYPYDHVAIDRALTGQVRLTGDEREEAVREGFRRGMNVVTLSWTLGIRGDAALAAVADLVGDDRTALDQEVRRRHRAGQPDHDIAAALGVCRRTVQASRARLGLAALYGPGGRRRKQVAA